MKVRKDLYLIIFCCLFNTSLEASSKENFTIATWNLEHWMSRHDFIEWKYMCEPLRWIEPESRDTLYPEFTHLPYCNALNGQTYPPTHPPKYESKPVHHILEWEEKRQQITNTIEMIDPDIIALQEVTSAQAVKEVMNFGEYEIYSTNFPGIRQQLAFAVKKSLLGESINNIEFDILEALAIKSTEGNSVRPGAILNLSIYDREISILNVHLKAGCSHAPLGAPNHDEDKWKREACPMLSKQLPILEQWIENKYNERTIVLGDFNRMRRADRKIPSARLDGTTASDAHTADTRYGSFFKELNDGIPKLANLTMINSPSISNSADCLVGFDHIAFNEYLIQSEDYDRRYLSGVTLPFSNGKTPKLHEVKTSNHCPVLTKLKIKPDPKIKPVKWLEMARTINVDEYIGQPVSTWLYGYDKSLHNQKLVVDDCKKIPHIDSLVCQLLLEQSRIFTLPENIFEVQQVLKDFFVSKVHRVVNGEHLNRYYRFLQNKGDLSTKKLDSDELRFVPDTSAPELEIENGKFIRPHIIQATAGVGVNVTLGKYGSVYNVGYIFKDGKPGRSYGISIDNLANDISYNELFENLDRYLRFNKNNKIEEFYTTLFELLTESDTSGLSDLNAIERQLIVDIIAVYLAEGFRYHTDATSQFHDDLITVLMLAPWAQRNGTVITDEGLVEMGEDGLQGFIVVRGGSSGLGFARNKRIGIQETLCKGIYHDTDLVKALSIQGDCLYGFATYMRDPDRYKNTKIDREKVVRWIIKDIPETAK